MSGRSIRGIVALIAHVSVCGWDNTERTYENRIGF
jgi:hypothetical protein